MTYKAYTSFGSRKTSQSEPIPGTAQIKNNAGGFAWAVDDWTRLDRFLILGSEGGTYYVGERKLTKRNALAALNLVKQDGLRVVDRVVEISNSGRAPKNDPALFILAMCAGEGDSDVRWAALRALPKVARIGTHLFHFLTYVQQFRGWGRMLRERVACWYLDKDIQKLSYQVIKYRQRDGWTHRDVLRLAHPKADGVYNALFRWITRDELVEGVPELVEAFEAVQKTQDVKTVCDLIRKYNLPREALPTQWLNEKAVWAALLERMPMTAMIRNLGKMTSIGLLAPFSEHTAHVVRTLENQELLRKARIHPLAVLVALRTYARGRGVRGSLQWEPLSEIVDALDATFYRAFENVEPSGKRIMLALDISGSMDGPEISGMPGITPRVGSAAMALVAAATEPHVMFTAFTSAGKNSRNSCSRNWLDPVISQISISPRQRLDDVIKQVSNYSMGGTDCALPMLYALDRQLAVDAFVIYTDSETWADNIHPAQALQMYRQKTGIQAKLVVVGMVSNGFSIADPNDPGMLDVVGMDVATPALISDFIRGLI